MVMDTEFGPNPETLFRPVKRRKFLRRRPDPTAEDQDEAPAGVNGTEASHSSTSQAHQGADAATQLTDVMRLRRPRRARKGGIEFSTTPRPTADNGSQAAVLTAAEDLEDEKIQAMCDRFTGHTGQTVDVDKHMMTYIETEMAKRFRHDGSGETVDSEAPAIDEASGGQSTTGLPQREPASLGKLHEIDLGQETKLQNIARTEAATRRLAGDEAQDPLADEDGTSKTVPPAREDGKPWRHRKRRKSEDIERDRLVEEVLRESKLDMYDAPEEEEAPADDQAADDRIAEQFRRDFIDAIQSRRRVARAKNTKTAKAEVPRGPKLGGSRSARAAMREQEKSQK
ncbi:hypothetical protein AWENTII_009598 [Aspergillus wentii]